MFFDCLNNAYLDLTSKSYALLQFIRLNGTFRCSKHYRGTFGSFLVLQTPINHKPSVGIVLDLVYIN